MEISITNTNETKTSTVAPRIELGSTNMRLIKHQYQFNSLAPGRYGFHVKYVNFQQISVFDILNFSCEIALWAQIQYKDEVLPV